MPPAIMLAATQYRYLHTSLWQFDCLLWAQDLDQWALWDDPHTPVQVTASSLIISIHVACLVSVLSQQLQYIICICIERSP